MEPNNPPLHLIAVKHNGKTECMLPEEIVYLQGSGKTTSFFAGEAQQPRPERVLTDGHNLGHFAYLLKHGFILVNQSVMVNMRYMLKIVDGKYIVLRCNWEHEPIRFSERCLKMFKRITNQP